LVAVIAAWSSYWHMVTVALRYGERFEVAYVLPLSVDGVLTVAAIMMAEETGGSGDLSGRSRRSRSSPGWPPRSPRTSRRPTPHRAGG